MKFIETQPDDRLKFGQSKTIRVEDCTEEEFISFVKDEVKKNSLELQFMDDDHLVFAHYPEKSILYFFIKPDISASGNDELNTHSSDKNNKSPDKSKLFINTVLIMILMISSVFPSYAYSAGYFSGAMTEDSTVYSSLGQAKFNTPTGQVTMPAYLSDVVSKNYSQKAFTFTNPSRIKNQPTVNLDTLPPKSNEDLLIALLAFREKFSLDEIKTMTGLQVSQSQLEEATQLAIWVNASSIQLQYQIDTNSISDSVVRALSTEITSWATQQVNTKGTNATMGNFIFPMYKTELNASASQTSTTDNYVEYGPYTVSGQKGSKFASGVLGGLLLDASKNEVKSIQAGQNFFVRFPTAYTGDKLIRLIGVQNDVTLNYGFGRLWLDKSPKQHEIQFSVGKVLGDKGSISVTAVDSFTNKPVEGVNIQVSTTTPLTTMKTDSNGQADFSTQVGTYKVAFSVPEGYLTPDDKEVTINFSGDIQTINLVLEWSQGIINFHSVDSQNLKPTGDSEAFIYDSEGKAVKRIAFSKGKSSGIVLPTGEYTLVQYKTDNNYAINIGTHFNSTAGIVSDVSVTQDPNALPTTITIDGASSSDSWIYTVSTGTRVLFKMNSSNKLTLMLPVGSYSVMAVKSDGTASTSPTTFSTTLNGETNVKLEKEIGTETVSFTFIDTVAEQPIPNLVVGLFDENHNLLMQANGSADGKVSFDNVKKHSVYYVNIIAAPPDVSGYSADGNRFLGYTRDFKLRLYSIAEVKEVTSIDTLYRIPNVTYTGPSYVYPTKKATVGNE